MMGMAGLWLLAAGRWLLVLGYWFLVAIIIPAFF